MDFNNKIVILKDEEKMHFLKKLSNTLINVKIITLSEFKNRYLFTYNKNAIKYVMDKYSVIYEVAKIYLDNIYYVGNINDDKIKFLNNLKHDLDDNNLLIYDNEFVSFINNSNIILYNMDNIDLFYKNIFDKINTTYYYDEKIKENKDIYKFNNIEDEVVFVANKICYLIKNGIDINKIKLANINDDYKFLIKRIFKSFNIPVLIDLGDSIIGTNMVRYFLDNYDRDISTTLLKTKELVKTNDDLDVYKQLLNIVNSYNFIDDYNEVFDMIKYEIENSYIKGNRLKNVVELIDINSESIDDEYVFLMSFNEGVIPINYKDEDYLSDEIKKKLNISTSYELNSSLNNYLKEKILSIKNIYISYSTYSTKELYISSLYDDNNFKIKEVSNEYDNSNSYNKLKLVDLLDNNKNYGVVNDDLKLLNNSYDISYMSYNNNFKGINKDNLYDYLNKSLTLSYTSVNSYYECSFKYYLSSILNLNKFKDTFEITIGNIFHKVLSLCFNDNFDFDIEWDKCINESKYEFLVKDKFFLNHLKGELLFIIDTIKEQLNDTDLVKAMYEKRIVVKVNDRLNITFKGFVDKILFNDIDGKKIVAIIDYKTGNPELNLDLVKYGLGMQLPIYLYLVNNAYKDVVIGGFYLQRILSNSTDEIEKKNNLRLCGYTNMSENVINHVDKSYKDSRIIKGLKVTSSGFSRYANVLSESEINDLNDLVKNNIDKAGLDILSAKFDINPKEIKDKNIGCAYCKYKDICYMNNKNIVSLGGDNE